MNELLYTLKLIRKNILFSLLCISVIAIGVWIVLLFYAFANNLNDKELPLDQGENFAPEQNLR